MRTRFFSTLGAVLLLTFGSFTANAKEVVPMLGGVLIDGYDFGTDIGPKGSANGKFTGAYNGLKMPEGRKAIFAWLHDTVNQTSEYIGPVGWLKNGTAGKDKGRFSIDLPAKYANGDFGSYEIIGFSSETTAYINGQGEAATIPSEPRGSDVQKELKPAFYLYAALPGADTDLHYCGHGQDFFYAKAVRSKVRKLHPGGPRSPLDPPTCLNPIRAIGNTANGSLV